MLLTVEDEGPERHPSDNECIAAHSDFHERVLNNRDQKGDHAQHDEGDNKLLVWVLLLYPRLRNQLIGPLAKRKHEEHVANQEGYEANQKPNVAAVCRVILKLKQEIAHRAKEEAWSYVVGECARRFLNFYTFAVYPRLTFKSTIHQKKAGESLYDGLNGGVEVHWLRHEKSPDQ